ncbi:hypothetical protein NLU13_3478 [Sarocladium strictum]|uniref:NmrA-like domain-containing protein n=1 Tax=Sarocladium strictum TaxID=5046 RepID=A0AA39GM39_SARSR|nr:hypothetical protein NLU13_3478 [Sarocladium strictum]
MLTCCEKRRRERGRVAQSAFRKRQAEAKQDLQAQNYALREAIAAVMAEVTEDDRQELRGAIQKAAQLAQLGDRRLCSATSSSEDIHAQKSGDKHTQQACPLRKTSQEAGQSNSRVVPSSECTAQSPRPADQRIGIQASDASKLDKQPMRCKECENINTSLLRFIGVSSFNFASILFWHIFLKHQASHHNQDTLVEWQLRKERLLTAAGVKVDSKGGVVVPPYPNIVLEAAALQDSGPEAWLSKVEARLDYCKRQSVHYYLSRESGQHGDAVQPCVYPWVDTASPNGGIHQWLTPTCAEQRIRFMVGEEVFAALASPMIERWEQGKDIRKPKEATDMIDKLLDRLVDTLMCSGDGPRTGKPNNIKATHPPVTKSGYKVFSKISKRAEHLRTSTRQIISRKVPFLIMVKVVVAGANSGLAREVIDKLVEGQKHEVVALVRRDPSQFPQQPGVEWVQVSFQDKTELVSQLQGAEVVLNFIVVNDDPTNTVGKLLIDASIEAGVRRFAPSEWAMSQKLHDIIDSVPWYRSKLAIQAYLREPGIFLDYLIAPHQVSKHLPPVATASSISELRVASVRGHEDDPVVFTSVADIAGVVRRAIEYEGQWPEVSGIRGDRLSAREMQQVLERVTGKPVKLSLAEEADLEAGQLKIYMPTITHPSIPEDQRDALHVPIWVGMLTATAKGANDVTGEWNELLPDYKFDTVEDFARKLWDQKQVQG